MEFLDLQIYAGARSILGRPVQPKDYRRSARNVKLWASPKQEVRDAVQSHGAEEVAAKPLEQGTIWAKDAANTAALHAGRMLRDATKILTGSDAMGLFHVPWRLSLATLTCWAFHHSSPTRGRKASSEVLENESIDESDE